MPLDLSTESKEEKYMQQPKGHTHASQFLDIAFQTNRELHGELARWWKRVDDRGDADT